MHPNQSQLADYAIPNPDTPRRRFPENSHPFRFPFQRDRDRIVHSRAFRRLENKTQVFLNGQGDHFRTRMTHTIEVAVIARTIARGLAVNEDLTEAIALAHDLGHTPFGHVGERELNALLQEYGQSFEHNQQSLRVVDYLEKKYPDKNGLNLTWQVRSGLLKHRTSDTSLDEVTLPPQLSIEAQIANLADDVAYSTHDLDDGIVAGFFTESMLGELKLWSLAREKALENGGCPTEEYFPVYVIRCLIDLLVGDIIQHSSQLLSQSKLSTPEDVQNWPEPLVAPSPPFETMRKELREFLYKNLYWHPDVIQVNQRMANIVRDLFHYFQDHPDQLGSGAQMRIRSDGLERAIADYIAGMTDHYALHLHEVKGFCQENCRRQ